MLICSFKSLHLSGPLGSLFISPSLAVGKSHIHVRSCSSFIGQLFIFVSDILSITACLLPCLQFKVALDALLARAPALEKISRTHESQKAALMFEIRHMVTELVQLSTLGPLLSEERRFVAELDAGLEHSILGGQLDTAAVWLHGKLLSSSEEGQQVDRARIVKERSNISKFMGGAKHRVDRAMPWGRAPMQPLALTHHFGGHSRGYSMYPTAPAWTNPGFPGQYGPSRGRGGGRGMGARKQPVCNKCKDTGKRGGDILHSHRVCPLVKCNRCHQLGHISKDCTNPNP